MKVFVLAAATVLGLAVTSISAQAGCVQARMNRSVAQKVTQLPRVPSIVPNAAWASIGSDSIVGLWKVVHYDSAGAVFFDGLEQWHADGTELELGNVPPAIGNICLGVWKAVVARKTYRLNHVGLDFTPDGASDGLFTLTATVTLSKKGMHFEGPSDVKIYDANGNLVQEVLGGKVVGDRIPVD